MNTNIVKVKYYSETTGELSGREYSYRVTDEVKVGDHVMVPVRGGSQAKAVITAIDVPEEEIKAFADKVKTIFVGSEPEVKAEEKGVIEEELGADTIISDELETLRLDTGITDPPCYMVSLPPAEDSKVQALKSEAESLKAWAVKAVIGSNDDLPPATNDLSLIANLKKSLNERKAVYIKPAKDHIATINAAFQAIMTPLEDADKILRTKILAYREEQRRREAAAARLEKMKAEAAELEAELTGSPPPVASPETTAPAVEAAPDKVTTDVGSLGSYTVKTWELVDFAQVPDWYKKLDEGKVTKTIKAGGFIAGIRIVEKETLRVDARRD
jgi:hypothetical protein